MALSFRVPTKTIEVPGGEITVRGLSSDDVVQLVASHADVAKGLFEQVAADPEASLSIAAIFGKRLLQQAPAFVAFAIALAAGRVTEAELLAYFRSDAEAAGVNEDAREQWVAEAVAAIPEEDRHGWVIARRTLDIADLPFPAQLEAATAVAELTFRSDADLKKTLEIAIRAMQGATAAIEGLRP